MAAVAVLDRVGVKNDIIYSLCASLICDNCVASDGMKCTQIVSTESSEGGGKTSSAVAADLR